MSMLFSASTMPQRPILETKQALILVDLQNDFVSPEGKLFVSNTASFLNKLPDLVSRYRTRGDVIWIQTEYQQARPTTSPVTGASSILLSKFIDQDEPIELEQAEDIEAFLSPRPETCKNRPCIPKTIGASLPDMLKNQVDQEKDISIIKSQYSAFEQTQLLLQLRTRTITHIYVCGALSNISVYATVLDAVRHGLTVTLIEDCLGYRLERCHLAAMLQMVDGMGANGVDYQELMDDLAGLLGDVINEEDFSTRYQVSLPSPTPSQSRRANQSSPAKSSKRDSRARTSVTPTSESGRRPSKRREEIFSPTLESIEAGESSSRAIKYTPEPSPPRKRSSGDLGDIDEDRIAKLHQVPPCADRFSWLGEDNASIADTPAKPRIRKARNPRPSTVPATKSTSVKTRAQVRSTGDLPGQLQSSSASDSDIPRRTGPLTRTNMDKTPAKRKIKRRPKMNLGIDDVIGEGDCKLVLNIMAETEASATFEHLKQSIEWQKMFHRSGEVPRLVAVQGETSKDGTEIPIYRHPADESPALLPFDPSVNLLRRLAEATVGHKLNHVLIQWYRNGEDNISEHSDKTLDIVHGSKIVNMSFGARRTMTLRTKKSYNTDLSTTTPITTNPSLGSTADPSTDQLRKTQHIPLPHASIFILGPQTNTNWLHSIRPDKRPQTEKSIEELNFNGERISLTFRQIGTFIDLNQNTIWGQGATSKTKNAAKKIINGIDIERAQRAAESKAKATEPEGQGQEALASKSDGERRESVNEAEALIRAFGQENHLSEPRWSWEEWYGRGFDVVNFETKESQQKS